MGTAEEGREVQGGREGVWFEEHQRKPYCHECFYRLFAGTGALV